MKINRERILKRKKMIFSSMFVISSLVIMMVVSFSWLNNSKYATVSDFTITAVPADNLMVKFSSDTEWKKKISMNFPDTPMKPVSGDGISFFSAIIGRNSDTQRLEVQGFESIEERESYGIFEADFSMIVENQNHLKLTTSSLLRAAEGDISYPYDGVDAGEICSAMRVAFMLKDENNEYQLLCVWMPNSNTEASYDDNGYLVINKNGSVEDSYKFRSSTEGDHVLIETNGESYGIQEIDGVKYVWGNLEEDLLICEMAPNVPVALKVVIWLDGEDRECCNEMIGGQVVAKFDFAVDNREFRNKEFDTE